MSSKLMQRPAVQGTSSRNIIVGDERYALLRFSEGLKYPQALGFAAARGGQEMLSVADAAAIVRNDNVHEAILAVMKPGEFTFVRDSTGQLPATLTLHSSPKRLEVHIDPPQIPESPLLILKYIGKAGNGPRISVNLNPETMAVLLPRAHSDLAKLEKVAPALTPRIQEVLTSIEMRG